MTWQARYPNARFAQPLLDNLLAILKRDEANALAWANRDANNVPQPMTAYNFYGQARRVNTQPPGLMLVLRRSNVKESEDGAALYEEHIIDILIENTDTASIDDLAKDVEKRCVAADMIIRSAGSDDLYAGYSRILRPYYEITPHEYADFFNERLNAYKRTATATVTFSNLMESI